MVLAPERGGSPTKRAAAGRESGRRRAIRPEKEGEERRRGEGQVSLPNSKILSRPFPRIIVDLVLVLFDRGRERGKKKRKKGGGLDQVRSRSYYEFGVIESGERLFVSTVGLPF